MTSSAKHQTSTGQQFQKALTALAPHVDGDSISRKDFDRVLAGLGAAAPAIRHQLEAAIAAAGLMLKDDPGDALVNADRSAANAVVVTTVEPVSAARAVLAADRSRLRPARVILKAHEEAGLAVLIRGKTGAPLPSGGFGRLEGEARSAAECLFLHNQGLIHSVAKQYAPVGMEYDDLVQHGAIGLIRAVELFDPSHGTKFSTYAMNWVRQSITRGIANESRLIRIPVHMWEKVNKVWAARADLTDGEKLPTIGDIAQACQLTEDEVRNCLRLGPQQVTSLDQLVGDDTETTLGDLLSSQAGHELTAFEAIVKVLLRENVSAVLDTLSDREAGVISMRFGLDDDEPKTLEQIGVEYGVTRERIRQIEGKVMTKLRHRSRSGILREFL